MGLWPTTLNLIGYGFTNSFTADVATNDAAPFYLYPLLLILSKSKHWSCSSKYPQTYVVLCHVLVTAYFTFLAIFGTSILTLSFDSIARGQLTVVSAIQLLHPGNILGFILVNQAISTSVFIVSKYLQHPFLYPKAKWIHFRSLKTCQRYMLIGVLVLALTKTADAVVSQQKVLKKMTALMGSHKFSRSGDEKGDMDAWANFCDILRVCAIGFSEYLDDVDFEDFIQHKYILSDSC